MRLTYEEGVATVTAHHPHPLWLDRQRRLGGLLLRDHHDRAQVDDASAVGGAKDKDTLNTGISALKNI